MAAEHRPSNLESLPKRQMKQTAADFQTAAYASTRRFKNNIQLKWKVMGQINILNYTHSVGAWSAHLEYSPMLHNLCTKLEKNPGVQINIAMRFAFMMGKIPKCKLCVTCCRQQF